MCEKAVNIKPSGIRKFFDIANEMEDVISLSVGEPDFHTPWHIREAGIKSLEGGRTRYTPNRGYMELREEIAKYMQRRYNVSYKAETDVLVTVGGSEAIDLFCRTVINSGDEVIVPEPSFVCYAPIVQMAGGVPVIIKTKVENKFKLTAEELENAITEKTKALVVPFPNNPTGATMNREELCEIAKIVKKHDILVLSDEIYSELTYGKEKHTCFASIPDMLERTVVVGGFSKSHSMTGWRMGFATGPKEIISIMTKIHQYAIMSAPTTSQFAAIEAMKNGDADIEKMRAEYDMRRRFIVDGLNKIGLTCFEPKGAFYAFPSIKSTGLSSEEFCEKLIYSKRVAIVPGTAFGESGEGFVRISYCYSLQHIKEALKRMKEFLDELKTNS
ncbi:MAG: aminotransferase class I/II-fold pyridoxal phosphate-dependent enzyme [Clostridia bacterium]